MAACCWLSHRCWLDTDHNLSAITESLYADVQMIIAGTDTSSVTMFYLLKACQDDSALESDIVAEVAQVTGEMTMHLWFDSIEFILNLIKSDAANSAALLFWRQILLCSWHHSAKLQQLSTV